MHFENGRSDAGCWRRIERSVRGRRLGVRHPERREDLILLVESLSQGDQDLPLRVHSTVHAFLDTVNGSQRDFGLSGQLRLSHQSILTQLPDAIPLNRSRSTVFHTLPFSLDRPVGRACCYTLVSACGVSSVRGISLGRMRPWKTRSGIPVQWELDPLRHVDGGGERTVMWPL